MGSAILAYPTLKILTREYPGAELFFMIFEKNRASVDLLKIVPPENVLTIREKSLGAFLADVFKIISRMRREGIDVVRSSAHRDRRAILSRQHAIALAAERARTILEITARTGTTDLLAGGQALAAQLVFTGLSELDPAILGDLKPNQTVGLIDVLGRLRKSGAETRLIDKRVEELGRKLAEELRRAAATSSDGKLTPDQIDDHIRRKFFGTAA